MSGREPAGAAAAARSGIIGARVQRREDPRLLTGRGSYTDDRKAAGAVHVAFCRSDRAHARIAGIDIADARHAPGVLGVFTAAGIDAVGRPIRATSNMPDYRATEFVPLARGKVRYVGEPVAAVVAENRYLAEDAAALVSVDYDPLPDAADPEAALDDRVLLHEEAGTNLIAAREFARGDVTAAMASAALVV
ncbi:MAG: xanthine dehydrogenase family protein molybdopterin-binding subunit, partial [Rhodospirillaceae bacterium]|nr:xanthine dehydrogenase family protein molybdopterin-binding subunit [Rhodospirillaceae bacterium]